MKIRLLLTIILLFSYGAQAQVKDSLTALQMPAVAKHLNKITISLLGLSYNHEAAVSSHETLTAGAGLALGYAFEQLPERHAIDWFFIQATVAVWPYVEGGYRNYYNMARVQARRRHNKNNTGNYLGARARAAFADVRIFNDRQAKRGTSIAIVPYWGLQRDLGSNFSIDFNAGPEVSYYVPHRTVYVLPAVRLAFSYNL